LQDFYSFGAVIPHRAFILVDRLGIGFLAIHEMRILAR
jgi:hypothetical protein